MTRVFLDTNIIIEWLNSDAAENGICTSCIEQMMLTDGTLLISPTTLAIVFYFVSKKIKNKKLVIKKLKERMQFFEFTSEDAEIVEQSFNSEFTDLEDAIQYFSAVKSRSDAIISFNAHDFASSKIPVYHPLHFLSFFN